MSCDFHVSAYALLDGGVVKNVVINISQYTDSAHTVGPAPEAPTFAMASNNDDLQAVLLDVEEAIARIEVAASGAVSESTVEGIILQAELLLRDVIFIEDLLPPRDGEVLVDTVASIVGEVQHFVDHFHLQRTRQRGRPQIPIYEEQIRCLLELQFSTGQIASLLHVSTRTIRRRIIQYGLQEELSFSMIDDTSLDAITEQFIDTHPNSGQKSLAGFFRSNGLRVQRCRVRESLMRVDPRGVQTRFRQVLHRRRYNVCMPNSLWHIDGYHRLIRWRIVVHGGIDGYSRLPVYLRASTNNLATTVLHCFLGAVQQYGLPSRVRCDRGGENVRVSEFMLNHPQRGPGRRSCITGRSVHNQRIERLWRDVFQGCISLFYHLFYQLEDDGLLDPCNNTDLFALHYVFISRINHQLSIFRDLYSHHQLRTARNLTPLQLWIRGMTQESGDCAALQGALDDPFVRNYNVIVLFQCVVMSLLPSLC